MKISEYLDSKDYLNINNIITLNKYENYVNKVENDCKILYIKINQDILETYDVLEYFKNIKNKTVLICSPDIDFPPPKKPYKYDKYFDLLILPINYLQINYYEKINLDIVSIINKNNLKVFSHSVSINNSNIINIPIGIYSRFNHFQLKNNNKNILCYLNFGLPCDRWFGNPRKKILEYVSDKKFITKKSNLDINEFYKDISSSKYTLCPRGCGIDTYRLWDCICLGSIPIVEKYEGHDQFTDLPILFLNNLEEYITLNETYLNLKYEEFLKKDFKYEKLLWNYWLNLIEQDLN